ncbi:MAG: SusC/RagA family TonB-linked outer membrane protein [Flavisolibacter sp.]
MKQLITPRRLFFAGLVFSMLMIPGMYGVSAQEDSTFRKLNGIVKSANSGALMAGVTVAVKGSNRGTVSDGKGRFSLLVTSKDTLVVTAVGFSRLESPCGSAPMLTLNLPEEFRKMDEVLVIGYGNERKRNITGSISSIDADELSRSPALSFDNAITGKAAGVQVLSSSGVPGSATAITIRGLSTLNPDGNNPLIVIDGIPVYGAGKSTNNKSFRSSTTPMIGFGGTSVADNLTPVQEFENNPLAGINPSDIESIEILKDAYATSIYGSRGAAGVILVTTKKGAKGTSLVNVRYTVGTVEPVASYPLLNGPQYNEVYTAYYKQLGWNDVFSSPYNTDWVKEVTRKAISQQADVSFAGSGEKTQYYVSGSYADQPSYVINNGLKRYTGRVNLSYHPSALISGGVNMSMSYIQNTAMNAPMIYRAAVLRAPNLPVRDDAGNFYYGKGSNPYGNMDSNPVADALLNTNKLETSEQIGNVYLQVRPFSWLTLRSEAGAEFSNSDAYTRRVKRPSGFGDDAVESSGQNRKIVINNTINFLRSFNHTHYVNAVAGQSYEQSNESAVRIGGYGFFSDDIRSISAAQNKYISASLKQQWALVSYFSRLNYEYRSRYLAGVTYRVDGSSRFSRNRRYVGFPSFSLGWRISEEKFLKSTEWINDLKLRGSVGYSGNNNSTSYYGSQGQYRINSNNLSYAGTPILQMQQPDNPNLKWERTRSIDVGVDAVLFRGRFNLTADYYQRRIRDLIMTSAIPLYQGWSSQPQNIGDMMNTGIELYINSEWWRRPSVSWSTSFNISRNTNKVQKLNFGGEEVGLANDAYKYLKEGEPAGLFYLYQWQGVDPMTGDPLWNDGKGGVSNVPPPSLFALVPDVNVFRQISGSSLPQFFGGMGNVVRFRDWELNAFISFSVGNKMLNGSAASLLTYATEDANNLSTAILDYWLVPGHETKIPRLVNHSITSAPGSTASGIRDYTTSRTNSRFLEDASYARLRTLSLTYNISPEQLVQWHIGWARFIQLYVRGTNLFTWTGYSGLDPEVNAFGSSAIQSGYDELTMPQNKLFQFGFNIGF